MKCLLKETKFNRISLVTRPLNEKSIQWTRRRTFHIHAEKATDQLPNQEVDTVADCIISFVCCFLCNSVSYLLLNEYCACVS